MGRRCSGHDVHEHVEACALAEHEHAATDAASESLISEGLNYETDSWHRSGARAALSTRAPRNVPSGIPMEQSEKMAKELSDLCPEPNRLEFRFTMAGDLRCAEAMN
ncbi:hypothetical protein [Kibdelosporangium banguiense]|uniref:hypothetical protein n=1 Tax=Kibdelosporangium banguiense TaxID=1365924 RepID=UPI001AE24B53|nr:hypothetical protein [Kibdelosporangium banguiense]